jgi:nucleotide-binding universal stress UspA family protein
MGDAAEQLAAVAASAAAEMVIVGSRGRRRLTSTVLGSVSRTLMALCDCPVLVVPPRAHVLDAAESQRGRRRPPSVLCGIDGSAESIQAARAAFDLATRLGDRLLVAHAYQPLRAGPAGRYDSATALSEWIAAPGHLAKVVESLPRGAGPQPELVLEPGGPRDALIRVAGREHAELLVLGWHADRPLARRSTTASLVASSPVPTPDRAAACGSEPGRGCRARAGDRGGVTMSTVSASRIGEAR